jgi:hypothetical protein
MWVFNVDKIQRGMLHGLHEMDATIAATNQALTLLVFMLQNGSTGVRTCHVDTRYHFI